MFNRKRLSFNNPQINEAFEPDNVDSKGTRADKIELNHPDDVGKFISELDRITSSGFSDRMEQQLANVSGYPSNSGQQETVLEDSDVDVPKSVTSPRFKKRKSSAKREFSDVDLNDQAKLDLDRMSISNFKNIHSPYDGRHQLTDDFPRNMSYSSAIQMKDIPSDQHIYTGRKYRKCSTFVITPKSSEIFHPDCGVCDNDGTDLKIKMLEDSNIPELFIEFDSLEMNSQSGVFYWMERSRWLRYEEDYDAVLKRFDSPHLSPMSVRGLSNFRKVFKRGETILDCHSDKYADVLKTLLESVIKAGKFSEREISDIRNALVLKHIHAGEENAASSSTAQMFLYNAKTKTFDEMPQLSRKRRLSSVVMHDGSRKFSRAKLDDRLEPRTEALSVQVGALESLQDTYSLFIRLEPPIKVDGLNEVSCPLRFIFIVFGPRKDEDHLLEVGRVFSIMMSNLEFREVGYSATTKRDMLDATKTFVDRSVLIPLSKMITVDAIAAMLPQLKHYSNYFIAEQHRLALEKFKKELSNKDQEVVINSYEHGKARKFSISAANLSVMQVDDSEVRQRKSTDIMSVTSQVEKPKRIPPCCKVFWPPFAQFFRDWKGLFERYSSDYVDAFKSENASIVFIGMIFIYFVVLSPAITFGALMDRFVSKRMTVTMCLISGGFFQFFYVLLNGQPLEVVGITGPVFVVEKVLAQLAKTFQLQLEVMRFWIGVYVSIFGFIFTFFNGAIIIKHFRRSVEEVYNFFVGAVFILSALFNMFKVLPYKPANFTVADEKFNKEQLNKFGFGGTTLFLAFLMVNFCLILVKIKRGSFFRRQIRNLLGSFNVPLGIILVVALERIFFESYGLPTLNVPPSNMINLTLWVNPPAFHLLSTVDAKSHAFIIAISVSLFAIFLTEISTNSIAVTKAERKLVKPSLYSLNFFYILVLFPLISAFAGWPFVSGAMVRSNAHCIAMSKWSLNLPGVPPKVIGSAEQRVSGLIVGLLVFLSVFLGSALRYIPMAAMYGMFLYMGVMGVRDLVVFRRFINLMQRRKHWDQVDFLKDFPTFNIIILVSCQAFFIGIIITLNILSDFTRHVWTILLFPVFVGLYAFIRGYIMPLWPKLNQHLSKMDKKHAVKLYEGKKSSEKIIVTMDNNGLNMKVISSENKLQADDEEDASLHDNESEIDKDLW